MPNHSSPEVNSSTVDRLAKSVSAIHGSKTAWIVLLVSLVITVAAYQLSSEQVESRGRDRFDFRATEIVHAIEERMAHYEQALQGGVALFNAIDNVNRKAWHDYVDSLNLDETLPGIQGMGYAIPVAAADKEAVEQRIREEGFPEFAIQPSGDRPEYSTIIYLEPFDWRNQRAFGYDMWSNDMRRAAMARARDEGVAATSGIITLVQETDTNVQAGFLTYLPVYSTKMVPPTVKQRRAAFRGWVYAPFRAGNLMAGVLGSEDLNIGFEIYDGTAVTDEALLYQSLENVSSDVAFTRTDQVVLQGRPWLIRFYSNNSLLTVGEAKLPVYVLVAGLIVDVLLFYVIVTLHLLNQRARKLALQLDEKYQQATVDLRKHLEFAEYKAKEAETFFQLAPEAFFIVNESGCIVSANKNAHKIFGYQNDSLLGRQIEELLPDELCMQHVQWRESYMANSYPRVMGSGEAFRAQRQSGEEFDVSVNLEPIRRADGNFVIVAVHDVTMQRVIENDLKLAKKNAEESSRAKSEFVANMSHEIRTPLNAVLGTALLLEKTVLTAEQKKYLSMVQQAGKSLLAIVNDILDLSKIEAGQLHINCDLFSLDDLLDDLAAVMSITAGSRPLELVIHCEPDVATHFYGDSFRLKQILMNLLSNAIKFTQAGKIVLRVSRGFNENGEALLQFVVSDTGIGMTEEQQSRLFNAFSQADNSITRRFGGTGLGLVICSKLMQMMGGTIDLQSQQGNGSVFTATLPLQETHGPAKQWPALRVLALVESPESAESIRAIAQRMGCKAVCVDNLPAATVVLQGTGLVGKGQLVVVNLLSEAEADDVAQFAAELGERDSPLLLAVKSCGRDTSSGVFAAIEWQAVLAAPLTVGGLCAVLPCDQPGEDDIADGVVPGIQSVLVGANILLVEDNLFNQTIASDLLHDYGATVEVANHGKQALDMLREQCDYDLILMDIQMPEMDGLTATRKLRDELKLKLPVIAMSAGVMAEEKQMCFSHGMDDFVAKPIEEDELLGTLTKYYRARHIDDGLPGKEREAAANVCVDAEGLKEPAFDASRIERVTKGRPERIAKICDSLRTLVDQGAEQIHVGRGALESGDYAEAKFIFHNLKGVVSNYGGAELVNAIVKLESGLSAELPANEIVSLVFEVDARFDVFVTEAKDWLDAAVPA